MEKGSKTSRVLLTVLLLLIAALFIAPVVIVVMNSFKEMCIRDRGKEAVFMTLLNGTGLAAWVLFYLIYFLKNALLRRSGIRANRIGKGEKPRAAARVERLLGPVTLTLGVLQPLSLWPGLLQPLSLPDAARWAGILLALVGDGVFLLSVYRMGASWRAGVDATQRTALVTDGIYAHSRNPAFLGFRCV